MMMKIYVIIKTLTTTCITLDPNKQALGHDHGHNEGQGEQTTNVAAWLCIRSLGKETNTGLEIGKERYWFVVQLSHSPSSHCCTHVACGIDL